ncbi:MAG TPA: MFS transporter, partial [Polyangiaceae bacterium]
GFMLVLGVATTPWQLAPATLFLGFTADAYRPASQALVADIVPPEHRMKAFGLQYWAINLGFSFAAVVGGYMARRHFGVLFLADAATTLVLATVVWRAVPESRPKPTGEAPRGSLLTPFGDPVFAPFLFLNFVTALIFFQHLTSLPEDMRSKGLSSEQYGMALASNGLLIVLLQPWVTKRVAHVPRARLLAAAAALTGLGYGLTTFARSLGTYMLTVAVWTLGEMIFAPVNGSLVADLSPAHARGRFQGAFSITWSLAFMVSPLLGPRLVEATNLRTLWLACLVVGLGVAVAHLTVTSRLLAKRSGSR